VKYDSEGDFGIGTPNPGYDLHIFASEPILKLESTSGSPTLRFTESSSFLGMFIKYYNSPNNLVIGGHNTSDTNTSNDKDLFKIYRSDGKTEYYPQNTANFSFSFVTHAKADNIKCYAVVGADGNDKFHVRGNGDVYIREQYHASDISLKENISDLSNSMDLLNQLRPVKYNLKSESEGSSPEFSRLSYGLIAQEVEQILPDIVSYYDSTLKAINYAALIPMLIDAVQSQQLEIEELKAELYSDPGSKKSALTHSPTLEEPDAETPILIQNMPNPFTENTIIKYSIPSRANQAMINVYDLHGAQVKAFKISQLGPGEVEIPATELSPGIYVYNLIVDAKVVDTKQMILTNR
jgi:hypothetical protein